MPIDLRRSGFSVSPKSSSRDVFPDRRGLGSPVLGLALVLFLAGCGGDDPAVTDPGGTDDEGIQCNVSLEDLADGGVGRNGIPSVDAPEFVAPEAEGAAYLRPDDRVLGFRIGELHYAVPLNILWWHEVVNLEAQGEEVLAVTYCPLTGSGLVFDRAEVEGAEFGVSGLLFRNNLVLFDRRTGESLWPQMLGRSICGPARSQRLVPRASAEMTWAAWRTLHPDTRVVSDDTGFQRPYTANPYDDYQVVDNPDLLVPMGPLDDRRPPKERVLGIPLAGDGGVAFPFGQLEKEARAVVRSRVAPPDVVVFWDREARAALAFTARAGPGELTFEVRDGRFVDVETGSVWNLAGRAVAGPLEGERLEPVADAYVAFWFAWAAFRPETVVWPG